MPATEVIFLGTSGAIQVPSFHCTCEVCEWTRQHPEHRRTRASLVIQGEENTLIDASPDLEFQLEREGIRSIHNILITHWHFDHIGGLAALGEPASLGGWKKIHLYLPEDVCFHFDQEFAYMKSRFQIHPMKPHDTIELLDVSIDVVKTTHTAHSVGFLITHSKRIAYLVDGVIPPQATIDRLQEVDCLILEATIDELCLRDGQHWVNFSVQDAINFWQSTSIETCILTHYSGHSWKYDELVAGMSSAEREKLEAAHPHLTFAVEGMRMML